MKNEIPRAAQLHGGFFALTGLPSQALTRQLSHRESF